MWNSKEIRHTRRQTAWKHGEGVRIPVVAIGGINARNAASLRGCGISGIAVVSAIFGSDDVFSAAVALKDVAREVIG